jgi:hypothetical protein
MFRAILCGAAAIGLTGCASSSGAYQVGPDTYRITATAFTSMGGQGTAKGSAIRTANDTCAKVGKHPLVVSEDGNAQFTQGSVDVTFRCVD